MKLNIFSSPILEQKIKKSKYLFIGFFINFDSGNRFFAITKDHVQVVVIGLKLRTYVTPL